MSNCARLRGGTRSDESSGPWRSLLVVVVAVAVAHDDANVAGLLADCIAAAFGTRGEALERRCLVDIDRHDPELVDIRAFVVLGVGDGRLEHLLQDARALLRAEREQIQRLVDGQPADLIGDEPAFLGRQANAAERSSGLHRRLLTFSAVAWLAPPPSCRTSGP